MKEIIKVETIEEKVIRLPDGFAEVGEKVHVSVRDDGSMIISKFVPVEVSLPDELFLQLALLAHEQDITLNELICDILSEYIEKSEGI